MTRRLDVVPPEIARRLRHKVGCDQPWSTRAELGRLDDPLLLCARCGAWQAVRDGKAREDLLLALGSIGAVTALDAEPVIVHPDPQSERVLEHRRDCTGTAVAELGHDGQVWMHCSACGRHARVRGPAVAPSAPRPLVTVPMDCARCGRVFQVRPGRPVVPLCNSCAAKKTKKKPDSGRRA